MIDKTKYLHQRDEKGEVIPITVEVPLLNGEIKILPMKRGQILKLNAAAVDGITTKDRDIELVVEQCVEPKFSVEELEYAQLGLIESIVAVILTASGVKRESDIKN